MNALRLIRPAVVLLFLFSVLLGVAYPLVVTAFAQLVFSHKANGSLVSREGTVIGSALLGQSFYQPKYFWSRLSATMPPYNAMASSGSNLSPANAQWVAIAKVRIDALRKADPGNAKPIPVDLVTASGSGLDPHISVAAAEYQVARVAKARQMPEQRVRELIERHKNAGWQTLFGTARINVLMLNLALDEAQKELSKEKR